MPPALPPLLYGTAWKEDRTRALVALALRTGFRGVDTANQRKHYVEAAVGEGLADSGLARDDVFLQTKFTFVDGQDDRLPYDPGAPVAQQVEQSFASSLAHLGTTWIDSYVLHGPSRRDGLGPLDHEAWRAMEALVDDGRARALGVSNVTAKQLAALCAFARIPPAFVQNRCYASKGWDAEVRALCVRHGIRYQGFSLLTANRDVLRHPVVTRLAQTLGRTPEQVVFRFALQRGMLPLTGTTDVAHMRADLAVADFALADVDADGLDDLARPVPRW